MVGITPYTPLANSRLADLAVAASNPSLPATSVGQTETDLPATDTDSTSSVSAMARQLSQAATRAESRDADLTFTALGRKASEQLDRITGNAYYANKAQHDAEVPSTNDAQLLARARQATNFTNGAASNPFKGMSRDQLVLITYDDSDSFTINEKRAALEESDRQEQVWRQQVVAKAMDEYNRTGKLTEFFTEVLEHYKGLPAIEQAQYPEDYASKLQDMIDLDFNYKTHQAEGTGSSPESLIEHWVFAGAPKDR